MAKVRTRRLLQHMAECYRKCQLQTKHDMDLKRLLKKGRIRLQKAGMQSWVELV